MKKNIEKALAFYVSGLLSLKQMWAEISANIDVPFEGSLRRQNGTSSICIRLQGSEEIIKVEYNA